MKGLRIKAKVKTIDAEHQMRHNLISVLLTNEVGLTAAGEPGKVSEKNA
jgi:hypothetical protein